MGGHLTGADVRAAIEKIRNDPPRACGITEPHVVHPRATGWARCANCFALIEVR